MTGKGTLLVAGALAVIVTAAPLAGCKARQQSQAAAVSDDTWATVDGRKISKDDVEKAFRRNQDPAQTLSNEEALTMKLSLLNELIVQDILLAKAQALKIEVPASELDAKYAEAKQNISDATFQEELKKRNLTPADMREGLRRELLTNKLIEQEVTSKVSVSEQEITDFFNTNREQFNLTEDAFHLAQIVVTPSPTPQIANRTGDDAATPQAAAAKIKMIMDRLKEGAVFADLAADYSEDPDTAQRGGNLGLIPISRLQQVPAQLRDTVLKQTPGTAKVVAMPGAYTIVLVIGREKAGQRDLSNPQVRENITQTLKTRKEQLLRTAYLSAARGDAQVVNYVARRVVESRGKV